ncbi:mpv17-like protein 2 [Drosophila guanche]|uniref:Blast:Mpv17-like protein 2 n=1 Tax=Drosophila guanche TaxID=7266 RepID=A0A3B0KM91_DROGU|nr:mpv17-like protein 2 [Drosophila guanche]SPP84918.1 blast:Mpv17-like protein 2 [Drosophila guanche]
MLPIVSTGPMMRNAVSHLRQRATMSLHRNYSRGKTSDNIFGKMFGKYLAVTNIVGSGLLLVAGDVLTQQYEKAMQMKRFDFYRSGRMFVTGLVVGPVQHAFYSRLDRLLPDSKRVTAVKKIFFDQLFMSPTYIFLFFYVSSLLEGNTIKESNAEIREKFLYTWMLDCMIWPCVQYLNFRFLNPRHRVIFINVTNCIYIVLLSYIKHDMGANNHNQTKIKEKSD